MRNPTAQQDRDATVRSIQANESATRKKALQHRTAGNIYAANQCDDVARELRDKWKTLEASPLNVRDAEQAESGLVECASCREDFTPDELTEGLCDKCDVRESGAEHE